MTNHIESVFPSIEPGVKRFYKLFEFRICSTDLDDKSLERYIKDLKDLLCLNLIMQKTIKSEANDPEIYELATICFAQEGAINIYYWPGLRLLVVDISLHKMTNFSEIPNITKKHFGLLEDSSLSLNPKNTKVNNNKIEVRDNDLGKGLFAKEKIKKGEFIGGVYGKLLRAKDCMSLPDKYRDHAMQCGENYWRCVFLQSGVHFLNHSCEPNCGVSNLFDFVAIKDIKKDEEITTDYAMQDDSNWTVPGDKCLCKSKNCRGKILPYSDLGSDSKNNYQNYVSKWIIHKYSKCDCKKHVL